MPLSRILSLDDAIQFVNDTASPFSPRQISCSEIRCIDYRSEGSLPPIGIPGAGLGLVVTAVAAVRQLETQKGNISFSFADITQLIEKEFGLPTFHTDAEHHATDQDELLCMGCGFCRTAFHSPEKFLLTREDLAAIGQYSRELVTRGIIPVVLRTPEQKPSAIMVIDSLDIAMPTVSPTGKRAYTYSRAIHVEILQKLARAFYERISAKEIHAGEVTKAFLDAASVQLQATIDHVGSTLPQFRVFREGEVIRVEPLHVVHAEMSQSLKA